MGGGSTILTVLDLEKSFGPKPVLRGVSLSVHDGDRIGVIGRNGSGKSTLLKMLVAARGGVGLDDDADEHALVPDGGTITWRRELTLEYVSQAPHLPAEATVGELLARDGTVAEHQIHTMAVGLELPPLDATIGTLSLGQRRRVARPRAPRQGRRARARRADQPPRRRHGPVARGPARELAGRAAARHPRSLEESDLVVLSPGVPPFPVARRRPAPWRRDRVRGRARRPLSVSPRADRGRGRHERKVDRDDLDRRAPRRGRP